MRDFPINLGNICFPLVAKLAVIFVSGTDRLICYSTLTTTGSVTVASGNSLTVAMNSGGIFTMA